MAGSIKEYTCITIGLDIKSPSSKVTSVSGEHLKSNFNTNVLKIRMRKQSVLYNPIGISQFFSNLEAFEVTASNLKYLTRSDFQDLKGLHEILLCDNKIEFLPTDIFDDLTELLVVDISSNLLYNLADNIFKNLVNLRELYLGKNNLESISESFLSANSKLAIVWLHDNQLISIEAKTFSHLNQLKSLYLVNNPCIVFNYPSYEIKSMKQLEEKLAGDCNQSCGDVTSEVSNLLSELCECENNNEEIIIENRALKNEQKACLMI